jgi:hypothetical protein
MFTLYVAFNLANTHPVTSTTTIADPSSVARTPWDVSEARRVSSLTAKIARPRPNSRRSANSASSAGADESDNSDGAVDDRSIPNAYQVPLAVVDRVVHGLSLR